MVVQWIWNILEVGKVHPNSVGNLVEFDVRTDAKYLERNIKLHGLSSDLEDKVKEVVTDYWYMFLRKYF